MKISQFVVVLSLLLSICANVNSNYTGLKLYQRECYQVDIEFYGLWDMAYNVSAVVIAEHINPFGSNETQVGLYTKQIFLSVSGFSNTRYQDPGWIYGTLPQSIVPAIFLQKQILVVQDGDLEDRGIVTIDNLGQLTIYLDGRGYFNQGTPGFRNFDFTYLTQM